MSEPFDFNPHRRQPCSVWKCGHDRGISQRTVAAPIPRDSVGPCFGADSAGMECDAALPI
eukprot:6178216-Pyramimonas_sp.AAC.1